jgi:alginate O-acetyltransferase complex protein AlgI
MTFLSYSFVLFFLASAAVYFAAPRKFKPGILLAVSLVFYGWTHPGFLALLVAEALPPVRFDLLAGRSPRTPSPF